MDKKERPLGNVIKLVALHQQWMTERTSATGDGCTFSVKKCMTSKQIENLFKKDYSNAQIYATL